MNSRIPQPGELWRIGCWGWTHWEELIILVKDVDIWTDDYGRQRFTVECHLDCDDYNGVYEDIDFDWQLVSS